LTVRVPPEFWRPLPRSELKYEEPRPKTVVLRPVVVALPWTRRLPVVVALPLIVSPEIAVPLPIVDEAYAVRPPLNCVSVEVALPVSVKGYVAARPDGVT
jgi:hypothetical protein